jgi:hypothetical protein
MSNKDKVPSSCDDVRRSTQPLGGEMSATRNIPLAHFYRDN